MSMISVSEAKAFINIDQSVSDYNDILQVLIDAADAIVNQYCNTTIPSSTFDYEFPGNNKTDIYLPFNNITSITNLYYKEKRINDYQLISSDYYNLYHVNNVYHLYYEQVFNYFYKANITAGYSTIPNDIKQVCKMIVSYLFREAGIRQGQFSGLTGINSISITNRDGITTNYKFNSMFQDFSKYLDKYKVIYV